MAMASDKKCLLYVWGVPGLVVSWVKSFSCMDGLLWICRHHSVVPHMIESEGIKGHAGHTLPMLVTPILFPV